LDARSDNVDVDDSDELTTTTLLLTHSDFCVGFSPAVTGFIDVRVCALQQVVRKCRCKWLCTLEDASENLWTNTPIRSVSDRHDSQRSITPSYEHKWSWTCTVFLVPKSWRIIWVKPFTV